MRFVQVHSIVNDEPTDNKFINPEYIIDMQAKVFQETENDITKTIYELEVELPKHTYTFRYTNEQHLLNTINNLNFFEGKPLKEYEENIQLRSII